MDVVNLLTHAAPGAKARNPSTPEPQSAGGNFDAAMSNARDAGARKPGAAAHAPDQNPPHATGAKATARGDDQAKADPRAAESDADPGATLLERLDAADLLAPGTARTSADADAHAAHDHDDDQPAHAADANAAQVIPLLATAAPAVVAAAAGDARTARTNTLRRSLDATASPTAPARGHAAAKDAQPDLLTRLANDGARAAPRHHAAATQAAPPAAPSAGAAADHDAAPTSASAFLTATLSTGDAERPTTTRGDGAASALNGLFGVGPLAHAAGVAQPGAAATTAPLVLQSPIGSTPWQQELGMQLVQLTQRGGRQVELHLNPKDLGPLQISLTLDHQHAQAQFFAAHAVVRDAVQQALPELRAALAGQGIALGEAMVGQQQQQQSGAGGSGHAARGDAGPTAIRGIERAPVITAPRAAHHIAPGAGVDLYA